MSLFCLFLFLLFFSLVEIGKKYKDGRLASLTERELKHWLIALFSENPLRDSILKQLNR
jgi:hypothetical protein